MQHRCSLLSASGEDALRGPVTVLGDCQCTAADFWHAVQLAVFGYGAQAVMTGEGPFKNLTDHLSNPTANNLLTNIAHPAL